MEGLFERIKAEYGIEIQNGDDMTNAWKLIEILKVNGWVVYVITAKGRNQVDA